MSKLCNLTIPTDRKIDGIDLFDENIDKNNRDFFSYWTRKSPELYKNISLNSDNYKLVETPIMIHKLKILNCMIWLMTLQNLKI